MRSTLPGQKKAGKKEVMEKRADVVSLAEWRERKLGVQKRGKSWEVAVDLGNRYPNGRKKYYREGGFDNEKAAKQREYELLHVVPEQEQAKTLFNNVATEWLQKKKDDIRFSSWKRYEEILSKHIMPYFDSLFIEDLRKKDIQKYYDAKKVDCRQSMGKHRAVLSQIFEMAESDQIIEDNIVLLAKMPMPKEPGKNWITSADELWEFLEKFSDSCLYLPVLIAASTGMRMSEILALTWQDINFKYGYITVYKSRHFHPENGGSYRESTKTAKSTRKVDVVARVLNILETIKKGRKAGKNDFVCINSDGQVFRNNTLSTNFRRAARADKRGGYNISFKSLRSSYATILRDKGVDEVAIQEELGHAQLSTTQNHYFVTTPHQREKLKNAKKELFSSF